jgi:hypothetical protein
MSKKLMMAANPPAGRHKGKVEILKMWRLPEEWRDTHFWDTTLIPIKNKSTAPVCGLTGELCGK